MRDLRASQMKLAPENSWLDVGSATSDFYRCSLSFSWRSCFARSAVAARYRFPALGDFVLSHGNYGHAQTNAFQTQFGHRFSHGLMFNVSYTYLD